MVNNVMKPDMQNNFCEFEIGEAEDEMECARFDITDDLLNKKAKIAAYMFDQILPNMKNEKKPFNPKAFPGKAIDIMIYMSDKFIVEIYLDTKSMCWDSKFKKDGMTMKLGPEQMKQFFNTRFYAKMLKTLERKWPLSDPTFYKYFDACANKKMKIGFSESELDDVNEAQTDEINQPGKRVDLANKDVTNDGQRDYSSTGRKILKFGEMGVKGGSGMYYCWPNPKYPFKWSQWKDWTKIKPLCKMNFVYNDRHYGISLSPFEEETDKRGFRGYDIDWRPPLGWLTPDECSQVMKLSIVQKFVRECHKILKKYINMKAEDVYEEINNKDKITIEEIRKTQRIIRNTIDNALSRYAADTYQFN